MLGQLAGTLSSVVDITLGTRAKSLLASALLRRAISQHGSIGTAQLQRSRNKLPKGRDPAKAQRFYELPPNRRQPLSYPITEGLPVIRREGYLCLRPLIKNLPEVLHFRAGTKKQQIRYTLSCLARQGLRFLRFFSEQESDHGLLRIALTGLVNLRSLVASKARLNAALQRRSPELLLFQPTIPHKSSRLVQLARRLTAPALF